MVEVLSGIATERVEHTELSLPGAQNQQTPVLGAKHAITNGCQNQVKLIKVLLQNITITCLVCCLHRIPCISTSTKVGSIYSFYL